MTTEQQNQTVEQTYPMSAASPIWRHTVACVFVALLCGSVVSQLANANEGVNHYAVICGVADYLGEQDDLNFAGDDANDMAQVLMLNPAWDPNNIILLTDEMATRDIIYDAIVMLANEMDSDDTFVFYFAGHGTTGWDLYPYDELDFLDEYLVTYDGIDAWENGYALFLDQCISDDDLSLWMGLLPTDHYTVFLDACHSGGASRSFDKSRGIGDMVPVKYDGFAADIALDPVERDFDHTTFGVVVTACASDELSSESAVLENGVFTYFLVEAISGAADANSNGYISAEECYDYILPRAFTYNPGQTAQILDYVPSELEFACGSSGFDVSIVGDHLLNYPMNTYYHDSRTQVIYTFEDIGSCGTIQAIDLFVGLPPAQALKNWTIRMKHTTQEYFLSPDFHSDGWTTVYRGNVTIDRAGWYRFDLHVPFQYGYGQKMMIDFSHDNSSYTEKGICLGAIKEDKRMTYACSDSMDGDPLQWTGSSNPPAKTSKYIPSIRFSLSTD